MRRAVASLLGLAVGLAAPGAAATPARADVPATGRLVAPQTSALYTYTLGLPGAWRVQRVGREPPYGTHLVAPGLPAIALAPVGLAGSVADGARAVQAARRGTTVKVLDPTRTAVRDAAGRIVAMVVAAEAPTPTAFALSLPHAASGAAQRAASAALARIGRSLRLYFGADDPRTVASDPAGAAQAAATAAALAAAPSLVLAVGTDPSRPLYRLEARPARNEYAYVDAATGQLWQLVAGGREQLWSAVDGCFRGEPAPAGASGTARWAALVGAGAYALRYQAPTREADGIHLRYGFIAATRWPVSAEVVIDPATNLPRTLTQTGPPGAGGAASYAVTFDATAALAPRPAPEPACP